MKVTKMTLQEAKETKGGFWFVLAFLFGVAFGYVGLDTITH
jgi:hypothetical protein